MIFSIIFVAGALASFPGSRVINLNNINSSDLSVSYKHWYELNEDEYQVINKIGETTVTDSTFLTPATHHYFNVLVNQSDGNDYMIAVKTGEKSSLLLEGQTPELFGMVSAFDISELDYQTDTFNAENSQFCLNDDGKYYSGRYRTSIFLAIVAFINIIFLIIIIQRQSNN